MNIPADSIDVSYESGYLILYNSDLKTYLFPSLKKSKDLINSSQVKMNGIDWMKVNETKQLEIDTMEVFIEDLELDYRLISYIKLPKNK